MKQRESESLERGLSPSRPSLNISWGQGVRGIKSEQSAAPTRKSAAPIVGKMPWLKGGSNSAAAPGGRASKFGPPVAAGVGITPNVPPPKLVTEPVKLGAVDSNNVQDTPLPPLPPADNSSSHDFSIPPPSHVIQKQPPLPATLLSKIPRNPTPHTNLNINDMLAAAKRHMQER